MRRTTGGGSPPPAEVGITASLLVLGHQAARLLERRLADVDLGAGEAVLLLALERSSLTMTGVMSTLHIRASTATSLVNRLENLGLVRRSPNPRDRRSLLVDLTQAGRASARQVQPAFDELDAALTVKQEQPTLAEVRETLAGLDPDS